MSSVKRRVPARPGSTGNLLVSLVTVTLLAVGGTAASARTTASTRPATSPPPAQAPTSRHLALSAVPDGPGKPAPFMDSRLSQLHEIHRSQGVAAMRAFAAANAIELDDRGRAAVLIHQTAEATFGARRGRLSIDSDNGPVASGGAEEALFGALEVPIAARVARLGGAVRGRVANLVDAHVPVHNLPALHLTGAVGWVEPTPIPVAGVVSEGVSVIGAAELQSSPVEYRPGADPVRVGVIDLGFEGHEALLGSELPPTVTVRSFHPGGISGTGEDILDRVHGVACAEIIFDVAPDVELFFANFNTISDNDAAVDWMISQNVDIISYSIGWTNAGPGDGRGPVNDSVQKALNAGIEWVTSAGNDARDHWQGTFNDPDGDGLHNFAGGDESNAVFLNAGEDLVVFLNWDDWFSSDQDYDLFIVDGANNVVAASTSFQTGSQNPTEAAGFTATVAGTYHVVVSRFSSTRDVELEMFFGVPREMQYIVPAGSLTIPADTDGAVAVGATFFGDDVIESFSAQGPTTDGRVKPELTAPDGVSTTSFGNLGFPFFGTSASAPHVAGSMALIKGRFGVFTLADVREILYGRALDRGIQGFDNVYGHGRVDVKGQ